jgi:hypothetical protein
VDTNTRRDPGPVIARYAGSRSFAFGGWVIAIIFGGSGAFLLWLASQVRHGGMKFTGDVTVLDKAGIAGVVLGVATLALFAVLKRRRLTIHVHERAIRAVGPGRDQLDWFDELEDIYLAPTGVFGYRTRPGAPWVIIDQRFSRMAELRQRLLAAQRAQRGPIVERALAAGHPVVFRHFSRGANAQQAMWSPRNVDHPTQDIVLDARSLTVEGKTFALAELAPIEPARWRDKVAFVDTTGRELHAMPSTSILSLDLLATAAAAHQTMRR